MSVTFAKGFRAAGVEAGISAVDGKKDLALVVNDGPLDAMAGVFTPNRFCAAPVQWTRGVVADGHAKAVILNSGGANACTGQAGYDQSAATAVAESTAISPSTAASTSIRLPRGFCLCAFISISSHRISAEEWTWAKVA